MSFRKLLKNEWLLSGDLATLLSGSYVEIEVLPLPFQEFVTSMGKRELSRQYTEYL